MVDAPHSSRNATPTAELQQLNLASTHNSPFPSSTTNTMTQQSTPTPSPSSTPPPSTGLKFSFSKSVAPQLKVPSKLSNGITAFQAHDDSDSDDESRRPSKVTHLENGAVVVENQVVKEEKKPLVIKPPEAHNEHWLPRRLKMFRPDMVDNKPPETFDPSVVPDRIGDAEIKSGLQITKRSASPEETPDDEPTSTEMHVDSPPKSEDDLARELLLAQAADPNYSGLPAQQKLVIPAREPLTEEDVYAYDMAHLSDAPTLEAYERVPVEAFGMGILLGLGWKIKEPKKRPDFLGIGAKEEAFLRVDDKGRKLSRKDGLGGSWNPLKKIDKVTGEVIVEEEKGSSRRASPKDRSGVSTPRKEGSRYGTPSGGRSGYDSGKERDRRRDDDRDRRRDKYRDDDRRDRRYDSDRESKRKDREYDSDRKYDSDYDRKRRRDRDGERSTNGSHKGSRRTSPTRSKSPRKDR
jgi:hypothetical protein